MQNVLYISVTFESLKSNLILNNKYIMVILEMLSKVEFGYGHVNSPNPPNYIEEKSDSNAHL